jgi:S-adenosyl-L-methionine hydrolase (adenosine-forming)
MDMPGYDWLTLTTDYGLSDGYAAVLHGVVGRRAPWVRTLDITHLVPPGDVARGAAVLAQTVPHLPPAVHLAVVDPGVGTARRAIAIEAPGGMLVGPDNGLLPAAADALGGVRRAVHLTEPAWFGAAMSRTFHGRDVFAPVAARLAAGAPLAEAGPTVDAASLVRLPEAAWHTGDGYLEAEVVTVDQYGNVQLAAPGSALRGLGDRLTAGGLRAVKGGTFADAPPGDLVVYVDSTDRIAVAINGGRAASGRRSESRMGACPRVTPSGTPPARWRVRWWGTG